MNELIIIIAKYFIFLPLIVLLIVFLQLKGKHEKWIFVVSLLVGGVISLLFAYIAGHLFYNARPFVVGNFTPLISHSNTNGFPSDHTLLASFIAWTIFLRYSKKYGVILLIIALLVGGARVLAGVHHPVDIIGSFIISLLAVLLTNLILRKVMSSSDDTQKFL